MPSSSVSLSDAYSIIPSRKSAYHTEGNGQVGQKLYHGGYVGQDDGKAGINMIGALN